MKLYQDVFTETEIISDSYPMKEKFDGVICEVKSRWIVKKDEDVDIGCGNAFGGGEEEEAGNTEVEKVLDLVDSFGYEETSHDKASFGGYFKAYMMKVKAHLTKTSPERVEKFMAGGREYFKWVNANFDDLSFYTAKDFDNENHIMVAYYEGEELAPTFIYVMDGLKGIKL